jgi:alkylhydroperoxidase family enzyme
MMTARIKGLEENEAPILIKPLYMAYKKIVGKVTSSVKVQAHRPSIAWFANLLGIAIERSKKVEPRLHFLVQFRTAQIVECPFCIDIIPAIGTKKSIVTEEELASVANWENSKVLSERDKIAIEYAEEISKTPVRVSDELFNRLKKYFNDEQVVELTASIAYENYRARFNHALGIESDNLHN